jgi:hypothetical protein
LHPEDPAALPAADVSLAQLLLLSADEAEFRSRANREEIPRACLWNGEWRRRLNNARRALEAEGRL